jgi:hypothetical protein
MRKDGSELPVNRLLRRRPMLDQIRPHNLMLGAVVSYSHKLCDAIELGPQPPEQSIWQDLERCEILLRVLIRDTEREARR